MKYSRLVSADFESGLRLAHTLTDFASYAIALLFAGAEYSLKHAHQLHVEQCKAETGCYRSALSGTGIGQAGANQAHAWSTFATDSLRDLRSINQMLQSDMEYWTSRVVRDCLSAVTTPLAAHSERWP
jgi:hypothetical protein